MNNSNNKKIDDELIDVSNENIKFVNSKNQSTQSENFEMKDVSFDDVDIKINTESKPNNDTKNSDTNTTNGSKENQLNSKSDDKNLDNSDKNEQPTSTKDDMIDSSNDTVDSSDGNDSPTNHNNDLDQNENKENKNNDKSSDVDDKDEKNKDDKNSKDLKKGESLKDKANDIKDKANKAKDNIKNAPENIKNKANEIKDKANQAKDNIKNAPQNLKNKANKAKDSWKNRPKNLDDLKNRAKNKAKNTGNNLKNKAKNGLKNGANRAKDKAKDKFNESSVGQSVQKGKEIVDDTVKIVKHIIKYWKIYAIGGGIGIFIFAVMFLIILITPGNNGNVNNESYFSQYSNADQKTLAKLKDIFAKYPNADGTLAFSAVVLPFYDSLIDGNVKAYLTADDNEPIEDVDDSEQDDFDYGEDIEETDTIQDDTYLKLFRKSRFRKALKKNLEKLSESEDSFKTYLKDTYFTKGWYHYVGIKDFITGYNGYKKLIANQKDSSKEANLKEALITNIYDIKNSFVNYVFENLACYSTSTEMGTINTIDLSGNISIILKDTDSTDDSAIKSAKSLYNTDNLHLTLKRYAMGVAYAEIGYEGVILEAAAKADMIAAQSLVLGRTAPGCKEGCVGMAYKPESRDGNTIFYMRGNTYDQDFCDVYEGCDAGTYYKGNVTSGNGEAQRSTKTKLDPTALSNLEKWYDEIANEFVYDDKKKQFAGSQRNTCDQGTCLNQQKAIQSANQGKDYKSILFNDSYSDTSQHAYVLYDKSTANISAVSTSCTGVSANSCGISNDDFIYYSQKVGPYANQTFCNRTDGGTIKQAGCGVVSMAMVVANLTDNTSVNPMTTSNEAYQGGFCGNGTGTSAGYFTKAAQKYGLNITTGVKSDSTNIEDAANKVTLTLKNGGLVIFNVNNSWIPGGSGHYIVAKAADVDGKLIIADPYADSLESPPKNNILASDIIRNYINNGHGWYMFTSSKSNQIVEKYCNPAGQASGFLGNPIDPNDTSFDYMTLPSAQCFPYYCGGKTSHSGFDLNSSNGVGTGKPVYAMDGGTISMAGTYSSNCRGYCFGNQDVGLGVDIDHGNGYHTGYYHFSSRPPHIQVGTKVAKGELIGYVGNTGNATGPHVHITLRRDDLYSKYGYTFAKGHTDRGLINAAKYINKGTYVGKME